LVAPVVFLINSSAQPAQTTPFIFISIAVWMCLLIRSLAAVVYSCLLRICSLATDIVLLSVSLSLPRNKCCSRAIC
jgi:hypothetical protein